MYHYLMYRNFHFIYTDQGIVCVKIPLNKGGVRGLCFFLSYPRSPFSRGQVSRGQVYNPLNPLFVRLSAHDEV